MINIDNINKTLNGMFNNAEKEYGLGQFYRYDPFKPNCKVLLVDLISAINPYIAPGPQRACRITLELVGA